MSIANDGSIICDDCAGQMFPGAAYADGPGDAVVELWPAWRHDPGYHICLDCLRREHEHRYLAQMRHLDALARRFSNDSGKAA
jgi:hypothetical protein